MDDAAVAASVFCGHWKNRTSLPEQVSTYDAARDVYRNSHGCTYRQLPQEFPALSPLYSRFELTFNSLPFVNWAAATYHVAIGICVAYLLFVAVGEARRRAAAAADRASWERAFGTPAEKGPKAPRYAGKPWETFYVAPAPGAARGAEPVKRLVPKSPPKYALIAWNGLLAAFSLAGFLRTMPHLVFYGVRHGFYASVCAPAEAAFGQGATGFWVMLFIFSKVPELVDTVFLVAARKPVIFLHWYHHFTVLLYCASLCGGGAGRRARLVSPASLTARSASTALPPAPPPPQAGTRTARVRASASTLPR